MGYSQGTWEGSSEGQRVVLMKRGDPQSVQKEGQEGRPSKAVTSEATPKQLDSVGEGREAGRGGGRRGRGAAVLWEQTGSHTRKETVEGTTRRSGR